MSSISSVGGASTRSLSKFIQRLSRDRIAADNAAIASASPQPSSSDRPDGAFATRQQKRPLSDADAMRSKIETAVAKALDDYHGSGDVHQAIREAIAGAIRGSSSTDTTSHLFSSAAVSSTKSKVNLEKALRSHGLSIEQFRKDLVAAFKSAKSAVPSTAGTGDPSKSLRASDDAKKPNTSTTSSALATGLFVDLSG
jgi:hypothetical protein